MPESRMPMTGRLVFGVVVIALGLLFTLDSMGLLDAGDVLRWWPAAPILYGVARLTGFSCRQSTLVGSVFTIGGALFLLHGFDVVSLDPWSLFWPLVLLAFGASMVRGALRHTHGKVAGGAQGPASAAGARASADSLISNFVMWSGLERKVTSQDFRGGDVIAIMGGAEIDLRQAKITGESASIDVAVLWGGVDLFVPEDWKVTVEAMPLMAGIEDGTRPLSGEPRGHLILRGFVLMGGVEIKN